MAITKINSNAILDGTIATADIADSAISTVKIASGAVTSAKTTGVGGANTPSFFATKGGNQNMSQSTMTKIQIGSEVYDTANCYDTSSYRFTPNVAGKYFVFLQCRLSWNSGNGHTGQVHIFRNGSDRFASRIDVNSNWYGCLVSCGVVDMNGSSDYVEPFAFYNASLPMVTGGTDTHFGAYKIIE